MAPGQYPLAVDLHLVNEVSSPQAFEAERGLGMAHLERTFACADHSISTGGDVTRFDDAMCEAQVRLLGENARAHGLTYFDPMKGLHGIIHVVAPEQGLTAHPLQPARGPAAASAGRILGPAGHASRGPAVDQGAPCGPSTGRAVIKGALSCVAQHRSGKMGGIRARVAWLPR